MCRALANITNAAGRSGQSAPKDIPGAAQKQMKQSTRTTAQPTEATVAPNDAHTRSAQAAQPPQSEPASFGSPERLMGMAGSDIAAIEEKEERARIEAHAEELVNKLRAGMHSSLSSISDSEPAAAAAALHSDDDSPLSPLPDFSITSNDLPELPDWFFPLEFELEN